MSQLEIGKNVGDWKVLAEGVPYRTEKMRCGAKRYVCQCTCGKIKLVRESSLIYGDSKGCGCKRNASLRERQTTHGLSTHPLYSIWRDMTRRCHDDRRKDYRHYGGRGITVCERWKGDSGLVNFISDMIEGYQEHLEIDRVDVNKGYSPDNCKWATRQLQVINRRPIEGSNFNANLITFNGKTLCISQWSEVTNIPQSAISDRLGKLGWSVEDTLTKPLKFKRSRVTYKNAQIDLMSIYAVNSTHLARARKLGVSLAQYCANMLRNSVFRVEGQLNGEWVEVKPILTDSWRDMPVVYSDVFTEFCEREGLKYAT